MDKPFFGWDENRVIARGVRKGFAWVTSISKTQCYNGYVFLGDNHPWSGLRANTGYCPLDITFGGYSVDGVWCIGFYIDRDGADATQDCIAQVMHWCDACADLVCEERMVENICDKMCLPDVIDSVVTRASRIFDACGAKNDFCLQCVGPDRVVFGGVNRVIWSAARGWSFDSTACTQRFKSKWRDAMLTLGIWVK